MYSRGDSKRSGIVVVEDLTLIGLKSLQHVALSDAWRSIASFSESQEADTEQHYDHVARMEYVRS